MARRGLDRLRYGGEPFYLADAMRVRCRSAGVLRPCRRARPGDPRARQYAGSDGGAG
ncbi:hypothetical protein ERY430_40335 [Erythrobacter sp. EC-HK427]|nr:hypothetical protein ERY430_40335 [Erythrobacter sp. EC-HK427]